MRTESFKVAADRRDEDCEPRQCADERSDIDRLAQRAEHQTPIGNRRPHAETEKRQARGEQDADAYDRTALASGADIAPRPEARNARLPTSPRLRGEVTASGSDGKWSLTPV